MKTDHQGEICLITEQVEADYFCSCFWTFSNERRKKIQILEKEGGKEEEKQGVCGFEMFSFRGLLGSMCVCVCFQLLRNHNHPHVDKTVIQECVMWNPAHL